MDLGHIQLLPSLKLQVLRNPEWCFAVEDYKNGSLHSILPIAIERTALIGWNPWPFWRHFCFLFEKHDIAESTRRHSLNTNWLKRHYETSQIWLWLVWGVDLLWTWPSVLVGYKVQLAGYVCCCFMPWQQYFSNGGDMMRRGKTGAYNFTDSQDL